MPKTNIIPFGKYKGQPLEQLQSDPEYSQWLLSQSWFTERYCEIRTLIVNNFKEPDETPEHNGLQARFLDRRFAYSVFKSVRDKAGTLLRIYRNKVSLAKQTEPAMSYLESVNFAELRENPGAKFEISVEEECDLSMEFEFEGWDVAIKCTCAASYFADGVFYRIVARWGGQVLIELKPALSEDFPAVLRQVKSRIGTTQRNMWGKPSVVVLVENFTARSVSFSDAQKIFETGDIQLVKLADIELIDPSDTFVRDNFAE